MRVRTGGILLVAAAAAAAVGIYRSLQPGTAAVLDRARFSLTGADSPGPGFGGGARLQPGDASLLWGSLAGGEEFVGELLSTDFQILGDALVVPVAGFPVADGNSLRLEILAGDGSRFAAVQYTGRNPGEAILQWRIPVGQWWKMRARLILTDTRKSGEAWLAIGLPTAEHVDPNP